jgi:hypothetical protein
MCLKFKPPAPQHYRHKVLALTASSGFPGNIRGCCHKIDQRNQQKPQLEGCVDIFPEKFSPAMTRQATSAAAEIIWRSLFFIYFPFYFLSFSFLPSFFF